MCKYKKQNICIVYRDRYKVPRGAMIVKLGSCTWNTFAVRHDPADTGMMHYDAMWWHQIGVNHLY